jgi:hypothetical protein
MTRRSTRTFNRIIHSSNRRRGGGAAANPLLTGLLAYYKFSEDVDPSLDSTGNWDLTAVNTPEFDNTSPAVVGKTGYYVDYELGDADYHKNTAFNALNSATKATWMFFVKPESTAFNPLVSQWTAMNNSSASQWMVVLRNDKLSLLTAGTTTSTAYMEVATDNNVVSNGTWYHVRITFDSTLSTWEDQVKMWIDGTEITALNNSNSDPTTADCIAIPDIDVDLEVGSYRSGGYTTFDGIMDELGIWDLIVSDADAELHRLATDLPY